MLKAALIPTFSPEHVSRFSDIEGVTVAWNALEDAEIILGNPTDAQIAACPKLKWVQLTNAGVNNYVNRPALMERGIVLTCASGAFGQSISECVLAMVLSLYKHLNLFRDNQGECLWRDAGRQMSPCGKKLLVLGAGDIGRSVARIMSPFGVRTVGVRTHAAAGDELFEKYITLDEVDEYLPEADIVVCSLPETEKTIGFLNAERIALLNRNAILINVGRGSLIDCMALADALNKGTLYGAALDVTSPEPLPADHPLWKCKNAIITPHATGGSFGHLTATEEKIFEIARENLKRYLKGEPLMNMVNFSSGYRDGQNRI